MMPMVTRTYEMNTLRGISGRNLSYDDEDYLLTAGTAIYSYNLDGFLTAKTDGSDVTTYDYSSRGELLSVTLPDTRVIEYVHDPLGRRIAKTVNGTITEKYLWQGLTRLLAIYDGSDNLLIRFEYSDGRMPVAMTKGGSTYYLTYDQVGSLRIVADASGNVVKRIDYDSFGNIIDDNNPSFEVPFGFAGGLHDRDTGFVRFGYRDYDPDTGRWTAKDPILFAGGETDLYGYCLSDPVNIIDPTGEILSTIIGAVAGASSGFISGLERGNIAAGILGGIAGGVTGALVGTINPLVGGAAGGAIGGAISSFLNGDSGPCVKKAAISSAIYGTIGALASTPIGILAKMGLGSLSATTLGKAAITMATTSVSTPATMISSHVGSSF